MADNGSNGLSLADLEIVQADLADLGDYFEDTEINQMSHEEVLKRYKDLVDSFDEEKKKDIKRMLKGLAMFIFVNGIHEQLPGTLKTGAGITWDNLKRFWGFAASKKQLFVRFVVAIVHIINASEGSEKKNLLYSQANKWGLMEDLRSVPVEFRYFGSYFHPTCTPDARKRVIEFQKKVISLSPGGSTKK